MLSFSDEMQCQNVEPMLEDTWILWSPPLLLSCAVSGILIAVLASAIIYRRGGGAATNIAVIDQTLPSCPPPYTEHGPPLYAVQDTDKPLHFQSIWGDSEYTDNA